MILDNELTFSRAQAVTTSAGSTNVVDFGAGRGDIGPGEPLYLNISVDAAATAAGAATVTFKLQTADLEAFTGSVDVYTSAAIAKADLGVGAVPVQIAIPHGMKRYARVYYTIGTGPLTAGKFTAALVKDLHSNR